MITIRDLLTDPELFGNTYGGDSFKNWRALLSGFYALDLDEQEAEAFQNLTARDPLETPADELWLVMGRRAGKSLAVSALAFYEAIFNDHSSKLAAGEVCTILVIASDRKQARAVMRYIRGMFEHPMFKSMIMRDQAESLELTNRCVIEITTASMRATRGYSVGCAILDECAHYHQDGASPDREIVAAIKPSLATLNGKLIALSSPYARSGILWDAYKNHYGKDSERVLVAQASSKVMNPTLPQHIIDSAYEEDPSSAAAELGALFRTDIEGYISIEAVDRVTRPNYVELPPADSIRYQAFTDSSGGVSDSFTLAIGYMRGDCVIIACTRSIKPPFNPESVVVELCELLKTYKIKRVTGDNYSGEFVRSLFRKYGINYDPSKLNRSQIYTDFLPLVNSERVELPPIRMLQQQLVGLERRTSRSGRGDIIDHPRGGSDDLANSVAGVAVHLGQKKTPFKPVTFTFQN